MVQVAYSFVSVTKPKHTSLNGVYDVRRQLFSSLCQLQTFLNHGRIFLLDLPTPLLKRQRSVVGFTSLDTSMG